MKQNLKQNVKAVILGLILTLGISYALADFTSPKSTPPTCVTDPTSANYHPGCVPPINAGSEAQIKTGPLAVGGLGILGDFKFLPVSGVAPTSGQVLMADETGLNLGKVKWGTPGAAEVGLGGGGNQTSTIKGFNKFEVFDSSGSWTAPAGVTQVMVEAWGGGGGSVGSYIYTTYGGGGGSYGKGIYSVTPGISYEIIVGVGGKESYPRRDGGSSSFGSFITSGGGRERLGGTSNGQFNIEGGYGSGGGLTDPIGGSSPMGGSGGRVGAAPTIPGGGGVPFMIQANGNATYGSGAHGRVVVWWAE